MVLVIVLVVVAMLALAGFTFTELMFTEHKAAHVHGLDLQAQAILESGVESLAVLCQQPRATRFSATTGGDPDSLFRDVLAHDDEEAVLKGWFSIVSPSPGDNPAAALEPGPKDESGGLNLVALAEWDHVHPEYARRALLALPGMTDHIADALLDWVDADNVPRPSGAESDYYGGLSPPYTPRNGIPESIEELLLVRGVTRELLFGERPDETLQPSRPAIDSLGQSRGSRGAGGERGWAEYLTFYSSERNVRADGSPRINVNEADLTRLNSQLQGAVDPQQAAFILAYRQFGPYAGDEEPDMPISQQPDLSIPPRHIIGSLVELIDAKVQIQNSDGEPLGVVASPLSSAAAGGGGSVPGGIVELFDRLTETPAPIIVGRVNVNVAPREVLAGLPGLEPSHAEAILSARQRQDDSTAASRQHAVWLLTEGLISREQMQTLMPFVTAGGDVYRAQVLAYLDRQPRVRRAEVVIDASGQRARVVSWNDLPPVSELEAQRLLGSLPTARSP